MVLVAIVMMPRVCGSGNDGRVPWRGLITLECRITTAREETSNLPPPDPSGTDGIGKCLTPTPTNINLCGIGRELLDTKTKSFVFCEFIIVKTEKHSVGMS